MAEVRSVCTVLEMMSSNGWEPCDPFSQRVEINHCLK